MAAKRQTPQKQGIEERTGSDSKTRYRAEVRIPSNPNRKRIRDTWRPNLAEARTDRVRLLAAKERGALVQAASAMPSVREAGEAWLDQAREGRAWTRSGDRYAPKTLRGYDDSFRAHVFPAFGDVPVDKLKRSRVQLLVDEVAAELSGQAARNTIRLCQRCTATSWRGMTIYPARRSGYSSRAGRSLANGSRLLTSCSSSSTRCLRRTVPRSQRQVWRGSGTASCAPSASRT